MKMFSGLLFITVVAWHVRSFAATSALVIDPLRSQITLQGTILGNAVQEQGAGSLTARFGGFIRMDASGATIQFPGGSVVDAITNGVWEPNVGGTAGSAPADFAGQARSLFVTVKGAFRNIVLDVTSGVIPLTNGEFDASALSFAFPANSTAALDYDLGLFKDALPLLGISTNKVTKAGTLTLEGGVQKLVIEVNTQYAFAALTEGDSFLRLTGQIVAMSASELRIGSISLADRKLKILVPDASPSIQLQGTRDFVNWTTPVVQRDTGAGTTTFTTDLEAGAVYFRAMKQ